MKEQAAQEQGQLRQQLVLVNAEKKRAVLQNTQCMSVMQQRLTCAFRNARLLLPQG